MNRFLKMNRFFKSCLLASAGLVILAATLSLTAPGRALAQRVGEDCVRICDTAASPLHVIVRGVTRVTGDVTINNENAIATTVTGPVQVTTPRGESLSVIPKMKVEDVFQKQVSLTLAPGEVHKVKVIQLPSPKLLEIRYASGTALMQPWLSPTTFSVKIVVIPPTNIPITFPLPLEDLGFDEEAPFKGREYQVGGSQLQIFAEPGSTVLVQFQRSNNSQYESTLELALSGVQHEL